VLVAGGTDTFRRQLAALLDTQGYWVESVTDASAALSALVMHAPDAVVLGDAPPAFDAIDACRRLRAYAGSRRTPVAVLAAASVPAEAGLQLDADLLPAEASPSQVVRWVVTRVPGETTPHDRLRLTLARATDDRNAQAPPAAALPDADWRLLFQHSVNGVALVDAGGRVLLAFGRRQVLVPQVVDLNVTVLSLEHMLARVIGEDVRFISSLAPDLRRVKVDPGQIEQVLLNLAINARDAMAEGGTLEVATANFVLSDAWSHPSLPVTVPAGDWVLLSVLDTGTGMDPDTAAQAFEPFFTTKDASQGSGLGLSMVYGIIKQSGGFTWIETAPGAGTSVHVLLPSVHDDEVSTPREDGAASARIESAGGTVLLVEDDPEVRSLFTTFLRDGGYVVREAADGQEALEVFERHAGDIDVVVTDVVMPNVSGPALASALRARKPDVRVLFVSGYTDQLELDSLDPKAAHVAKPVTRAALLRQIAALLGQRES